MLVAAAEDVSHLERVGRQRRNRNRLHPHQSLDQPPLESPPRFISHNSEAFIASTLTNKQDSDENPVSSSPIKISSKVFPSQNHQSEIHSPPNTFKPSQQNQSASSFFSNLSISQVSSSNPFAVNSASRESDSNFSSDPTSSTSTNSAPNGTQSDSGNPEPFLSPGIISLIALSLAAIIALVLYYGYRRYQANHKKAEAKKKYEALMFLQLQGLNGHYDGKFTIRKGEPLDFLNV